MPILLLFYYFNLFPSGPLLFFLLLLLLFSIYIIRFRGVSIRRQSCAMDHRPYLYASICITLPLAALVLVLRLLARRTTRAGYGIDDWLAVVAFVRYFLFHFSASRL
jgi:hypothetical protein